MAAAMSSAGARSPFTTPHLPFTTRPSHAPALSSDVTGQLPPRSRTTSSRDRSVARTASTRPWMSSLASTTRSSPTSFSNLSSNRRGQRSHLRRGARACTCRWKTQPPRPRPRTPPRPSMAPPPARHR
eukprot:3037271-Pleurochrysis_carterae.AAC.1